MNTSKPYMLFKSITTAANRNSNPNAFQDWITQVQNQVKASGQFEKSAAGYLPVSPPPAFWNYQCRLCRFWGLSNGQPEGRCTIVKGDINSRGWCVLWCPPDNYAAFSWPSQLIVGNW